MLGAGDEPAPTISPMKKLAIVGTHPDTRANAPFSDASFDIWVFNEAAMANAQDTPDDPSKQWCRRWDVCFQMHKPEIYTSPHNMSNRNHWAWLQRNHGDKIIFMQDVDPLVPNSVRYPLEDALQLSGYRYFTSSISYAMALAILQGYDYIELYGSDLVSNTEYSYQADCLRSWIMFAKGRGIDVQMKCWPMAFVAPLYGYDGEIQLPADYFSERAARNEAEWEAADKSLRNLKKAVDKAVDAGEWSKVLSRTEQYRDAAIRAGNLAGAGEEARRYLGYGNRAIYRQEYEHMQALTERDGERLKEQMFKQSGIVEYVWNVVNQTQHPQAIRQLREAIGTLGRYAYDFGARKGIFTENQTYMHTFDGLAQAAGGARSLALLEAVKA